MIIVVEFLVTLPFLNHKMNSRLQPAESRPRDVAKRKETNNLLVEVESFENNL